MAGPSHAGFVSEAYGGSNQWLVPTHPNPREFVNWHRRIKAGKAKVEAALLAVPSAARKLGAETLGQREGQGMDRDRGVLDPGAGQIHHGDLMVVASTGMLSGHDLA